MHEHFVTRLIHAPHARVLATMTDRIGEAAKRHLEMGFAEGWGRLRRPVQEAA